MVKDLNNIDNLLKKLFSGYSSVKKVPGEYINQLYEIKSGGNVFILKVYTDLSMVSSKLTSEYRAYVEYNILSLCFSNNINTPKPVEKINGAILMKKIKGVNLLELELNKEIIKDIGLWLKSFHCMKVDEKLLKNSITDLPIIGANYYYNNNVIKSVDVETKKVIESILRKKHFETKIVVPIRGDPTLRNWIIGENRLYGIDFEFFSVGNPVLDVSIFCISILEHKKFSEYSYNLVKYFISMYNESIFETKISKFTLNDLKLGFICSFILLFCNVRNNYRKNYLLGNILKTIKWLENCYG